MTPRPENKLIVLVDAREGLVTSIGRDFTTFGTLIATVLVLNTQMPPSGAINAAIAIVWILWVLGRATRHRHTMTPEQARDWLAADLTPKS